MSYAKKLYTKKACGTPLTADEERWAARKAAPAEPPKPARATKASPRDLPGQSFFDFMEDDGGDQPG